ncbi:DUF6009 family protein [Streptomyces rishiriensis]|uniref:DUF6009 family protein n=1 Tax=Streptomyces rishiriensis TaxID=68264 RepID=UPI0035A23519
MQGVGSACAAHREGRKVGYAVLGPTAKPSRASGTFRRHVLWLRLVALDPASSVRGVSPVRACSVVARRDFDRRSRSAWWGTGRAQRSLAVSRSPASVRS